MNIGIVTTWFERGAAYVSKTYMDALKKEGNQVYIYARGGESHSSQKDLKWNEPYVTREKRYIDAKISTRKFFAWISKNKLDAVLFNEQREYGILYKTKEKFPKLKIGAYVDYYTEKTLCFFDFYDFLICNTLRHMEAMKNHPQRFYIRWGTDINLFKPNEENESKNEKLVFFHSVGMSPRKGTDILVGAFIEGELYKVSNLLIRTQVPIESVCRYNRQQLNEYGIQIIEKTVPAPGLYYKGDVYVYPTRLDGLGLTMYEALSSGLPLITTDFPPMNEVGNETCVKLVKVKDFYCRSDAYFYPMAVCDKNSLIDQMQWFVNNKDKINNIKKAARNFALNYYNIDSKNKEISDAIKNAEIRPLNPELYKKYKRWSLIQGGILSWLLNFRVVYDFKNKLKKKLNSK